MIFTEQELQFGTKQINSWERYKKYVAIYVYREFTGHGKAERMTEKIILLL